MLISKVNFYMLRLIAENFNFMKYYVVNKDTYPTSPFSSNQSSLFSAIIWGSHTELRVNKRTKYRPLSKGPQRFAWISHYVFFTQTESFLFHSFYLRFCPHPEKLSPRGFHNQLFFSATMYNGVWKCDRSSTWVLAPTTSHDRSHGACKRAKVPSRTSH